MPPPARRPPALRDSALTPPFHPPGSYTPCATATPTPDTPHSRLKQPPHEYPPERFRITLDDAVGCVGDAEFRGFFRPLPARGRTSTNGNIWPFNASAQRSSPPAPTQNEKIEKLKRTLLQHEIYLSALNCRQMTTDAALSSAYTKHGAFLKRIRPTLLILGPKAHTRFWPHPRFVLLQHLLSYSLRPGLTHDSPCLKPAAVQPAASGPHQARANFKPAASKHTHRL